MLKQLSKGFSIIEALISIAIFSVAMLGAAKFQIEGTKNQNIAHFQTLAVTQAYDMIDRVKANLSGFEAGAYNNPSNSYHATCLSQGCTSNEMAENDFYEWQQSNQNFLPQGSGSVTSSGNNLTITVTWLAYNEQKSYTVTERMI